MDQSKLLSGMATEMEADMIQIDAMNIVSPLGFSVEENYRQVISGQTGVHIYPEGMMGVTDSVGLSLLERNKLNEAFKKECTPINHITKLEKAALLSVQLALKHSSVDAADRDTVFVISTTKGNIELLANYPDSPRIQLWHTAHLISRYFGNKNAAMIVSNACISGANALIVAHRALTAGRYRQAIVVGVDVLSSFIVSGFWCLKALSTTGCRPYDKDRCGLNLGEAAATIILKKGTDKNKTELVAGAIRNDANHISGPSRTGEGSFNALQSVCGNMDKSEIAFVNAHGTSTLYNDEMESIALTRAGLENTPVNSLKGYFGHTLGAAGILESALSVYALQHHQILATKGFEELGVTHPIDVVKTLRTTDKSYCIKLLSGFGGCNAALLFKNGRK
jgi:3-oxoacyl-[acyl-carrier-protein] synthase-1